MQIKPIDVHADPEFHRFYEILREADLFERPNAPMWSEREAAVMFRRQDPTETWTAYVGFDGDDMLGVGCLTVSHDDNTDKAWVNAWVVPARRRQGIGSALIDFQVREAALLGRTTLLAQSAYDFARRDNHPYRRFAEKQGFSLASTEIGRVLELPVDDAQLQEWIDEAAQRHESYRIETFIDDVPQHLLPSYCHVLNQLALDAPTGEIDFEAEAMTPEVFRARAAKVKEQGRTAFRTVALDDSQQVVAATNLAVSTDDQEKVFQWATLVLRAHRGHRLGLAIKARNLREVQRAHPDRKFVWTSNEETNGPMVHINERMGFRPVEISAEFQRKF